MRGLGAPAATMLLAAGAVTGCGSASHASPTASPATSSSPNAVSAIAPPLSDCSKFAGGTLPLLTTVKYSLMSGIIVRTNPTSFDYWVRVAPATAGITHLTVTESTQGSEVKLNPIGGQVLARAAGAKPACGPVTSSIAFPGGPATVTFDASAGATYFAQVTFSSQPLIGQKGSSNPIIVTVSTAGITGSSSTVVVVGA